MTISPQAPERVTIARLVLSGGASCLRLERVAKRNGVAARQSRAGTRPRRRDRPAATDTVGNDAVLIEWGSNDVLLEAIDHITNGGNGVTLNSQSNTSGSATARSDASAPRLEVRSAGTG